MLDSWSVPWVLDILKLRRAARSYVRGELVLDDQHRGWCADCHYPAPDQATTCTECGRRFESWVHTLTRRKLAGFLKFQRFLHILLLATLLTAGIVYLISWVTMIREVNQHHLAIGSGHRFPQRLAAPLYHFNYEHQRDRLYFWPGSWLMSLDDAPVLDEDSSPPFFTVRDDQTLGKRTITLSPGEEHTPAYIMDEFRTLIRRNQGDLLPSQWQLLEQWVTHCMGPQSEHDFQVHNATVPGWTLGHRLQHAKVTNPQTQKLHGLVGSVGFLLSLLFAIGLFRVCQPGRTRAIRDLMLGPDATSLTS